MKPERWVELEKLYHEVVDLDPRERDQRLAVILDHDLRREVVSLILAGPLSSTIAAWLKEERGQLLVQSPSSNPHRFKPGDLLAERYRIVEFLGQGGMGEVYQAEDEDLGERIAIKVIRSQAAGDNVWAERFRREVQLARRVTHPNVCRVFDMERSRHGDREAIFLTMELVQGETLAARLKRTGRLSLSDALPIATQLCTALDAAHQAGVLHRDFKCANIMLVGSGQQVRAVVTDFGTALPMDSVQSSIHTTTGAVLGTPAYMSPEQLAGKELTPASDIYSLGLVLYEMVTGIRPFEADSPWTEAIKRLSQDPNPPFKIAPEVGESWNSAILRCLERVPAKRFSAAHEVSDILQGHRRVATANTQEKSDSHRPRWIWVLVAVLVAALAFLSLVVFRAHPTRALTDKDVIVLADFTNSTGEQIFDGTLKEALAIDLEQSPLLNILSDVKVAQTLKLMGRPSGERLTPEVSWEICVRSNSSALIAGSIAALGSHYTIHVKASNCQTGDVLGATEAEANRREDILQALGRAAGVLRSGLGESLASVQKFDKPLPEVTTSSLDALYAYSKGTRAFLATGGSAAIPFFERAVELDPNFALAYYGLAGAYSDSRQRSVSVENMRKAYELRERASEHERFVIANTYYILVTGEFSKAVQQLQLFIQEYPHDASAYGNLGYVYLVLGQYEDAVRETREAMRLDNGWEPAGENLSYAYTALNQLDKAQTVLDQALSLAPDEPFVHYALWGLALARNDDAAMRQQIAWANGKPGVQGLFLSYESAYQVFHGRLRKALELNRQAFTADQGLSEEVAVDVNATNAIRYASFGYAQDARKAARRALEQGASAHTLFASVPGNSLAVATLALARAGDIPGAQKAARDLALKAPFDTLVQNFWLPTVRAEIEIKNGHAAHAIELLRTAQPFELNDVGAMASAYTRGRAYLALGHGSAAAEEFQKILSHNPVAWLRFPRSVAYLGLARAQALRAHSTTGPAARAAGDQARAAYQDFFELWNDADPDIPILRQAKTEYSKLSSN